MITLKRYFENWDTAISDIIQFKNNKLDLSKIKNQMFQKILKKYLFINIFKMVNNNNNNNNNNK
jgi:hypothetical protein